MLSNWCTKILTAAVAAAALSSLCVPAAAAAPGEPVPGYNAMGKAPEGANDWNCKPSPKHPRPVVLVHGTSSSMQQSFPILSPMLKKEGYCVFALNYGHSSAMLKEGETAWGTADLHQSAGQLSMFIDAVLGHTRARQVDIIGHSQGGMMPRLLLKNPLSAGRISKLVGLAPTNHGTSFNGQQDFIRQASAIPFVGNAAVNTFYNTAVRQQLRGSALMREVNGGGETVPGVHYTVIASKYDDVITPAIGSFLAPAPNVANIWVQDGCEENRAKHSMLADGRVLWLTMRALDRGYAASHPAPCPG